MTNNTEAEELMNEMLENFRKQPIQFVKPDLIKISEEFHFNGKGLWLGIERTPQPGADQIAEFLKARETLVNSFKAISGQTMTDGYKFDPEWNAPPMTANPPPVIDRGKETLKEIIQDCQTVDELVKQRDNVVKYGLTDMYADKLEELQINLKQLIDNQ